MYRAMAGVPRGRGRPAADCGGPAVPEWGRAYLMEVKFQSQVVL